MKILIPLAGHSRRFQQAGYILPKAFLPVGDRTMIAKVVQMFSPDDEFHFIVSDLQQKQWGGLVSSLRTLASKTQITVIPAHEKGPVHSVLQVPAIGENEPVIVNYCDFLMDWNYGAFLERCTEADGVVAVFQGFHPASLGNTYFAYVRREGERFLELREKRSFTEDRVQESASTGTYYFKSWGNFKKFAAQVDGQTELPETYVSLLYNPMQKAGLDVRVFDVRKFICLGTPEDLKQHQLWWDSLKGACKDWEAPVSDTNLILMAGDGKRFQSLGYSERKPFLPVQGVPMAIRAVESLPPAGTTFIVDRKGEQLPSSFQKAWQQSLGSQPEVIRVPYPTRGPAETCLLARKKLPKQGSVLVGSCDYSASYDAEALKKRIEDPSVDALIFTTTLEGRIVRSVSDYAYCQTSSEGQVLRVVEKQTISDQPLRDPLVVGSFWFRRISDLFSCIEEGLQQERFVNGELYIGTCMNALIERGLKIEVFPVSSWLSYGTPVELQTYLFWSEHFDANHSAQSQ